MNVRHLPHYAAVWVLDFEFIAQAGEQPTPVCMVAHEVRSGRWVQLWLDEPTVPPFSLGPDTLFVAYSATAEWSCFLELGWPPPLRCIDLYAEFVCSFNGSADGKLFPSLLAAAAHYGLSTIGTAEKDAMRELILSGGPWTVAQKQAIIDYCAADVRLTANLLNAMLPEIAQSFERLGHALLRGRYTAAVARMERWGVPIDVDTFERLRLGWENIKTDLIADVDKDFGVFDGTRFVASRFASFIAQAGIPWPRLPSGQLALDDDTFRERARAYPSIAPLRELRHALGQMRLAEIAVGNDGRARTGLMPFGSRTGRNQPSNSRFIFGTSRWLRGLIKPAPGRAIAYVDWSSQEIAIAAALSKDAAMWQDYSSGDPYMAFARTAGLVPIDATKASHPAERQLAKAILLGVGYGMSPESIASQSGLHIEQARALLRRHQETYVQFWEWATKNQNSGLLGVGLQTTFGWTWRARPGTTVNPRSLLNWPMQANGAEMMRLACCALTEKEVTVCCPVHDALLVEGDEDVIDDVVATVRAAMAEASELVLGSGFVVRTDAVLIRHPDRYQDDGGFAFWSKVMHFLDLGRLSEPITPCTDSVQHRHPPPPDR